MLSLSGLACLLKEGKVAISLLLVSIELVLRCSSSVLRSAQSFALSMIRMIATRVLQLAKFFSSKFSATEYSL